MYRESQKPSRDSEKVFRDSLEATRDRTTTVCGLPESDSGDGFTRPPHTLRALRHAGRSCDDARRSSDEARHAFGDGFRDVAEGECGTRLATKLFLPSPSDMWLTGSFPRDAPGNSTENTDAYAPIPIHPDKELEDDTAISEETTFKIQVSAGMRSFLYDKPVMNWAALRFLMVAVWIAISCSSNADTYPSDGRTWEQVTAKFLSAAETRASARFDEVDSKWGQLDAWRLRDLNSTRALKFLTSYTAKAHPPPLRVKAVQALGWGRFHHAIPVLSEIASDQTEPADLRAAALDPGLILTARGNATVLRTALALSEDKEPSVRGAAYMVLGRQQNARAVAFLIQKLRTGDAPAARSLIVAIAMAKESAAARIILDNCSPADLPKDALEPYVSIVASSGIPEAKEQLFSILPRTEGFTREMALGYFGKYPREAVVPHILKHVEASRRGSPNATGLHLTLKAFIAFPSISQESKLQLADLLTSGKVCMPQVKP